MKTLLKETFVDMAKGTNPKTLNLLDKKTGTCLTRDGEEVVYTTICITAAEREDEIIVASHKAGDYYRPNLNIFGLMDYSHRVAMSVDKAKSGKYLVDTDADLEWYEDYLLAPSVYKEKLDLFLSKCGFKETCDTKVTKKIRTWSELSYVLQEEETLLKWEAREDGDEEPEVDDETYFKVGNDIYEKKVEDHLMLIEGATASKERLLEAQLLKLRPNFETDLFCDYEDKLYTHEEVIQWAKSSSTNNTGE